mmetsp:Transcript_67288/g.161306  ORF Transcript_67288/g.161306 Transcript_67288/m.161306 type:complete len:179 (+) Transcript_67288:82-618(+)
MPKVRRERTKYHDKAPKIFADPQAEDEDDDEEGMEGEEVTAASNTAMSRGQRKRAKRREDFMRKFDFVNFVREQEEAKRTGSLADMTGLADELTKVAQKGAEESGALPAPIRRAHGRRGKAAEDEREITKFQNVLAFEAFQKDPLGSIEQHLRNSIAQQQAGTASASGAAGKKRKKAQ